MTVTCPLQELELARVKGELEKREHLNEQLHEAQTKMERLFKEAQQHRDEERPLHEQVTVT